MSDDLLGVPSLAMDGNVWAGVEGPEVDFVEAFAVRLLDPDGNVYFKWDFDASAKALVVEMLEAGEIICSDDPSVLFMPTADVGRFTKVDEKHPVGLDKYLYPRIRALGEKAYAAGLAVPGAVYRYKTNGRGQLAKVENGEYVGTVAAMRVVEPRIASDLMKRIWTTANVLAADGEGQRRNTYDFGRRDCIYMAQNVYDLREFRLREYQADDYVLAHEVFTVDVTGMMGFGSCPVCHVDVSHALPGEEDVVKVPCDWCGFGSDKGLRHFISDALRAAVKIGRNHAAAQVVYKETLAMRREQLFRRSRSCSVVYVGEAGIGKNVLVEDMMLAHIAPALRCSVRQKELVNWEGRDTGDTRDAAFLGKIDVRGPDLVAGSVASQGALKYFGASKTTLSGRPLYSNAWFSEPLIGVLTYWANGYQHTTVSAHEELRRLWEVELRSGPEFEMFIEHWFALSVAERECAIRQWFALLLYELPLHSRRYGTDGWYFDKSPAFAVMNAEIGARGVDDGTVIGKLAAIGLERTRSLDDFVNVTLLRKVAYALVGGAVGDGAAGGETWGIGDHIARAPMAITHWLGKVTERAPGLGDIDSLRKVSRTLQVLRGWRVKDGVPWSGYHGTGEGERVDAVMLRATGDLVRKFEEAR